MARTRKQAQALLRKYSEAHDVWLFKGCGDPNDWDHIDKLYARAKERMIQHLTETKP